MTIYLVVPLLLLAALLQATLVPHLSVWGVFADLPLVLVVTWSLLQGSREGAVWGFVAGLAVDLLSGAPFGAATLSLIAVGLLAGSGHMAVFRDHLLLSSLLAILATVVYSLIFMLVLQLSGEPVVWFGSLARIVLPSALLNACLLPIVYGLARPLHHRFLQEKMEF